MRVAITGATGLVGAALRRDLEDAGVSVLRLVRAAPESDAEVRWDPSAGAGAVDPAALDGVDAVVHLAGEPIAAGRWNAARKLRIRDSRVRGTRMLCETLASLVRPPAVLVAASATGYYGDRGDQPLDEGSPPGGGFLPGMCAAWEAAADPARRRGIRVVNLRLGLVLAAGGGALAKMVPPFRLGLGGPLGSGRQWTSWIALDDLVGIVRAVLERTDLAGALNAVAPEPVTNREFARALGRVLRRPAAVRLPAAALRLLFGEMADATLLASTRVLPVRLLAAGHAFRFPELEPALRHVLLASR